jgi:hypothetical protein
MPEKAAFFHLQLRFFPYRCEICGLVAGYVWVGRFETEDHAQGAANKIQELGLPVAVVPRHTDRGDFFVVFTGPLAAKRVSGVLERLQTQGFPNAHSVGGTDQKANQ